MFDVSFSSNAKKFLKKAENNVAKRLVNEIEKLREGLFRNKSHLFEYSLKKYLEDN